MKCQECGKRVWPWQKQVWSNDHDRVAHKECKPEGFHKPKLGKDGIWR